MNFKEQVAKVRSLLSAVFEDVPAAGDTTGADTLQDYTTDGGVIVKIDRLEVGGMVYMQDGTTPVTTGFTLADGTIVAVDANGMITAVTAPVAAAAPIVPGVPAIPGIPAAPAYPAGFEERFAALEKQVADFIAATTPQKFSEQTDAKFQKFSESLTAVIDLVEKFAAQPSDDPAQPPNGNANEIKMSKQERREMLAKNIAERVKA